ncbi:prothymosin alpha isoform X1 [Peromyscus californicus insignis]|uniref:prothymosin alpha isoform X1 n=1 Tax=Peromyscus californicus insignis TaxID=564181 RepID=UPI0022A795B3|nr:prothymosin alpha isoform X1 [Peromyscus californicus insignis]
MVAEKLVAPRVHSGCRRWRHLGGPQALLSVTPPADFPREPGTPNMVLASSTQFSAPWLCRLLSSLTGFLFLLKDLKEKKEVVEEAENGRDAPANGNANEENGEQEADNEVDEEEEEGGEEDEEEEEGDGEEEDGDEDEEAEAPTGKRVAEDDEDDDVDTKKQKTDEDD